MLIWNLIQLFVETLRQRSRVLSCSICPFDPTFLRYTHLVIGRFLVVGFKDLSAIWPLRIWLVCCASPRACMPQGSQMVWRLPPSIYNNNNNYYYYWWGVLFESWWGASWFHSWCGPMPFVLLGMVLAHRCSKLLGALGSERWKVNCLLFIVCCCMKICINMCWFVSILYIFQQSWYRDDVWFRGCVVPCCCVCWIGLQL